MLDGAMAAEPPGDDGDAVGDVELLDAAASWADACAVSAIRVGAVRDAEAIVTSPVAGPAVAGMNAT